MLVEMQLPFLFVGMIAFFRKPAPPHVPVLLQSPRLPPLIRSIGVTREQRGLNGWLQDSTRIPSGRLERERGTGLSFDRWTCSRRFSRPWPKKVQQPTPNILAKRGSPYKIQRYTGTIRRCARDEVRSKVYVLDSQSQLSWSVQVLCISIG